MDTGAAIVRVRKSKRLTQKKVCADLDLPLKTYQAWEQGINIPKSDGISMLAKYFGVLEAEITGRGIAEELDSGGYSVVEVDTGHNIGYRFPAGYFEKLSNRLLSDDEIALVDMYRAVNDEDQDFIMKTAELVFNKKSSEVEVAVQRDSEVA